MVKTYEDGYKDGMNHTLKIIKRLMVRDGFEDVDKYTIEVKNNLIRKVKKSKQKQPDFLLRIGNTYLINEERPKLSIKMFLQAVNTGFKGLWISREPESRLKTEYDLTNIEYHWLTKMENREKMDGIGALAVGKSSFSFGSNISPKDMARLLSVINNFVTSNEKSVILLDGMEAITTENDFSSILKLLAAIKDHVSTKKGVVIFSLDLNTLNEIEKRKIKKEVSQDY